MAELPVSGDESIRVKRIAELAQAGVQERLPDATGHLSQRFFLAGGERNVCGGTHGYPTIG